MKPHLNEILPSAQISPPKHTAGYRVDFLETPEPKTLFFYRLTHVKDFCKTANISPLDIKICRFTTDQREAYELSLRDYAHLSIVTESIGCFSVSRSAWSWDADPEEISPYNTDEFVTTKIAVEKAGLLKLIYNKLKYPAFWLITFIAIFKSI